MSSYLLNGLSPESLMISMGIEKLCGKSMDLAGEKLLQAGKAVLREGLCAALPEDAEIQTAQLRLQEIRKAFSRREINSMSILDGLFCNNCGSCAYAVWRRLSGTDPDAIASYNNVAEVPEEMELITGLKMKTTSPEEIERTLRALGPGSHLIVGITRRNRPGHYFNAYFDGKNVWTLDGMKGKVWPWPHNYGDIESWSVYM